MYSINADTKFRELVERYQREDTAHLRHSSLSSNKSRINRLILPLWGDVPLADVKPLAVEKVNELPASKKPKLHIKAMMHKIFNFGLKCEMVAPQPNPMRFVTIHGVMRRVRKKHILSPQQFKKLFRSVDLRMQTMISLATCNGLGASEFLGLQWPDFDFKRGVFSIRRSITGKHLEATKTVAREDEVIMAEKVVSLLLRWKRECPATLEGWLFPNADTGRPYHADSLRTNYLQPAGRLAGIPNLGWHDFRHRYRTLIDDADAPIGVQMKLMRHSNIAKAKLRTIGKWQVACYGPHSSQRAARQYSRNGTREQESDLSQFKDSL
jgi:integrase